MNTVYLKKKISSTYRPIGEMEVRETNIFLRVTSQRQLENMVKFMEIISMEMNMLFLDQSTIQRSIYYLDPLQDNIDSINAVIFRILYPINSMRQRRHHRR
jgi:tRNA threonylcarbamoyladenosine modification (KEOPS) complex Cgi121 subunit